MKTSPQRSEFPFILRVLHSRSAREPVKAQPQPLLPRMSGTCTACPASSEHSPWPFQGSGRSRGSCGCWHGPAAGQGQEEQWPMCWASPISGILSELHTMALEALSSNCSWKIPLQTIFLNSLGMLLKLLRNCHSSASNTENFNKLWDNFSSQVEGAEDSQAYFHLLFCRNTDTDPRLCKAVHLK